MLRLSGTPGLPHRKTANELCQHGPGEQRNQTEGPRDRGHDALTLPQLVEVAGSLASSIEAAQPGSRWESNEKREQRCNEAGTLHNDEPDTEARKITTA